MEEWRASLDLLVVPVTFIIYLDYHFLLLYGELMFPGMTCFGSKIRRLIFHLDFILQTDVGDGRRGAFVTEISSYVALANTYGSYSAALMFFIGGLLTTKRAAVDCDGCAVTGDVKCGTVLVFALAAFLCFMEGGKTLGEANSLINRSLGTDQASFVDKEVVRGFIFCEAGSRLFYFSLPLVAWFLGPIPMLAASLMRLIALFMKDIAHDLRRGAGPRREMIPI